jgi:hypothetical protein
MAARASLAVGNPFAAVATSGAGALIPPNIYTHLTATVKDGAEKITPTERLTLAMMKMQPGAIWIDSKEKLYGPVGSPTVQGALAAASQCMPSPSLIVFVLYNLPNRDCAAMASAGEICCVYGADGRCNLLAQELGCKLGMWEYREQFVRPFARLLADAPKVPVAVILEPDSLPNLITNAGNPRCGAATRRAYTEGVAFAISHIATVAPQTHLYVDAGHGGWLGWDRIAASFLKLVCVELDVSPRLIRGFSTNIANYNLLGEPCPKDAFIEMMTAGRWCNQVAINHTCCSASNVRQLDLHSSCASHLATRFTSGSLQTRPKVLLGPIGACLRADVIEAR